MIIRPYPPQGGSGFPHASYRVGGPAPNADTGGTRVRVYTYDNIMSWRGKRGHRRRKYIYGPGVDEPISMIEAAGSYAGTYYYHFDGLGSVVSLTNASGSTVQVYEYETYGRVGATDASHPNRILFTGREYDKETGLYYYRARYYNPQIGRFLQTDPVGYGDGMNLYAYCRNSPLAVSDPSGCWAAYSYNYVWASDGKSSYAILQILCWADADKTRLGTDFYFTGWDDVHAYIDGTGKYTTPGDFCDGSFDGTAFRHWTNDARGKDRGPGDPPDGSSKWKTVLAGTVMIVAVADGLPGDELLFGWLAGAALSGMVANEIINHPSTPTSPAESDYWNDLDRYRGKTRTDGEKYYEWDYTHGHIEVYDKRGNHLGTQDKDGRWVGGPKPGRKIRV